MDTEEDAFLEAAKVGDVAKIMERLEQGINVDQNDWTRQSALHHAAAAGHTEACQVLLDHKADIQITERAGSTPLHLAAWHGHIDVCKLLLERGANPNAKNYTGLSPMHAGARRGHAQVISTLLDYGANVNIKSSFAWTPLHRSAVMGHLDVCQILLERGADVKVKDEGGRTCLHEAASHGHPEVCEKLLSSHANLKSLTKDGTHSLHLAASKDHSRVCQVLLNHDADINVKTKDGKTALDLASDPATIEILKQAIKLRDYRELMSRGSKAWKKVKLFFVGDPAAGKTTIKNTLQRTMTESLVTREENIKHPEEEHDATPGIKILTVDIPSSGRFSSWDCAGHCEYHVTHTMFLGSRNSIFLINYDITLKNSYKRVQYWLNFIKASRAPNNPNDPTDQSYVILVATHVDLVENKLQAYESAALIHQEMMSLFKDHMIIVDEVILLNSHKSREKSMRKLREIIEQCSDSIKKSKSLPKLCSQIIKRKKNWASENYPILTWSEYKQHVTEIDPRVEDDFLWKATEFLVDCGEIYLARLANDDVMIVLTPDWLCSNIFGPAFANDTMFVKDRSFSRLGHKSLYTVPELNKHFHKITDVQLLLQLLQHLGLGYAFNCEKFVIPSLLPDDMPPWDKSPVFNEYYGQRVKCSGDVDIFAAGFFPGLQVCLMQEFSIEANLSRVSKYAVKFTSGAEGMVLLTVERHAVDIIVRGKGQQQRGQCFQLLKKVLKLTYIELQKRSPGTCVVTEYLSPHDLRNHMMPSDVYSYTEEALMLAEQNDGLLVNKYSVCQEKVSEALCAGHDPKFLNILKWNCDIKWMLETFKEKLVDLLEPVSCIGLDHRALAQAFKMCEQHVLRLQATHHGMQARTMSVTATLLEKWSEGNEVSTFGALHKIFKDLGRITGLCNWGREDAATVLEEMFLTLDVFDAV